MQTIANILRFIFIVALVLLIAPTLFEILAFCFVVILQVVVTIMVLSFLIGVVRHLFDDEEDEGQPVYSF